MSVEIEIAFAKSAKISGGLAIGLGATGAPVSDAIRALDPAGVLDKAVSVAGFTAKARSVLDVVAPKDSPADRIGLIGTGEADGLSSHEWMRIGGKVFTLVRKASKVAVLLGEEDLPSPDDAADLALGLLMRAYDFDTYKSPKPEDEENGGRDRKVEVTIVHADAGACKKAFADRQAVADGVRLARDLVNEPANVLGPVEFAAKAKELEALGVEVEILGEKELRKLKMEALLGVAVGSSRPPRLAVMQWKGGKSKNKPVAFVGKGVVFDTGGISIKPSGGMEDMKGDMGGAAAVIGLMHTLAARKAKVNAIGIIGLVENMPDGAAQRPGDIVRSMSGQTIEIINTDAEGRLVLCDALWYCRERFEPVAMVNLATLTGAIIVALGNHHAGLFSNDDELSAALTTAGEATEERVWRMPLGPDYDKMIDSKFADIKNTGGRHAGAITAAQFLKRFVKDTPWAHLDIAGTAMGSPATDINQSWGSGFGVRLLDRYVRDRFEILNPMAEALFYHLTESRLEDALPPLLEKSLERGWTVSVHVGSAERCEALDAHLWTFREDSFLPHGIDRAGEGAGEGNAARQPVLLTLSDTPANGASVRFAVDGAAIPTLDGCERLVVMFDGHDQVQLEDARARWKELKAAGHALTYWQQTPERRWERKA